MPRHSYVKTKVSFDSQGATCSGYIYSPEAVKGNLPCVVMAHGFSGTMDWILPSFAERFASAGLAVMIFDYRHFGESEGQPRQIVVLKKQRADLKMALEFAKRYKGIDPKRITLWGTSLGGSHVIEMAANDSSIAAVIANMPSIDSVKGANIKAKMEKSGLNPWQLITVILQLLGSAILDALKGFLGLSPFYIKVWGKPGRAVFGDLSLAPLFKTVQENSPTWKNKVAPRILFGLPRYREGTMDRVRVPLLICLAEKDVEVSATFVKAKAKRAPLVEIKEYPYEHFEMYHGQALEQVIGDQIDFLHARLLK